MYYISGDKYEGEFKNDRPNGKGTYTYKNGRKYVGDIVNTLAEGNGIMYFEDGNRYEGEFKNDKPNGRGIFYFSNGKIIEGEFKDGIPILNIENLLLNDNARQIANNIVNKLFGLNVNIIGEIYEKTFDLPTCIVKIIYTISTSIEAPIFNDENMIKVQDGRIKEFDPNIILSKGKIIFDLIGNINTIFKTISIEIGDGTIKFSVNENTFIIEINYREHCLTLEINPKKVPLSSEKIEAESYCSNNSWKVLINFGLLLNKSFPSFKPFPMTPNII